MKPPNKEGKYKVMFTKQMNGSFTTRMSIPYYMLKDIGVTPMDKEVIVSRIEDGIVIRKLK